MTAGKRIEYANELGKYLLDISKVILGSAVVLPIFQKDIWDTTKIITGAVVAGITLVAGIIFKTLKI